MNNAQQAANYLIERQMARESLNIMDHDFAPNDMADAYAIQEEYLRIRSETKGALGGYKVGLTNH